MPDVKDAVRALRVALKLSQEQVAIRSENMTRNDVNKVEAGKNQASGHKKRIGFARAFGLSIGDLDRYLDGDLCLEEATKLGHEGGVPVNPVAPKPGRPRSRPLPTTQSAGAAA